MKGVALSILAVGLAIMAAVNAEPQQLQAASPVPPTLDIVTGLPGGPNERAIRARANLEALTQGRLLPRDLSPQELQDVLDFERIIRGGEIDNRTIKQQCVDEEVRRNGGRPSQLAWQVIRMKCR